MTNIVNYLLQHLTTNGKIDWEKIYPNIDLAETLSCVKGEMIKKQEKEKVSLDGGVIDYKNIEFADVKDLLWWYDL